MVLQNYQNLIEMTSNIFHIVAFGVGFKCLRKMHLNTQWGGGALCVEMGFTWTFPRNQDAKVKLKSELISIKF